MTPPEQIIPQQVTSSTQVYKVWTSMKQRCLNPKDKGYKDYGGRGIKVCERWMVFANFISDMGPRPDGMTIERMDNDGDYEPSNCRWATQKEQKSNYRRNRFVTYRDQRYTLRQLCDLKGMRFSTLRERMQRGWTVEDAVDGPIQRKYVNSRTIEESR